MLSLNKNLKFYLWHKFKEEYSHLCCWSHTWGNGELLFPSGKAGWETHLSGWDNLHNLTSSTPGFEQCEMFVAEQWDCTVNSAPAGMGGSGLGNWCWCFPDQHCREDWNRAPQATKSCSCQDKNIWKLAFFMKYLSQLCYTMTAMLQLPALLNSIISPYCWGESA